MEFKLRAIEIENFLSFKNTKISGLKDYKVLIDKISIVRNGGTIYGFENFKNHDI